MLWDTAGRTRLAEAPLVMEEGAVNSIAFSPDGKTIAASCVGRENVTGNPDVKKIASGYGVVGISLQKMADSFPLGFGFTSRYFKKSSWMRPRCGAVGRRHR